MKNLITKGVLILVIILSHSNLFSQYFDDFFNTEGKRIVTLCAHPAMKVIDEETKVIMLHGNVVIDIRYEIGAKTVIIIDLENGIIKKVSAPIENLHLVPAFATISILDKFYSTSTDQITNITQKKVWNYYENLYKKSAVEFSGAELTAAILSFEYANYVVEKDKLNLSKKLGTRNSATSLIKKVEGVHIEGSKAFVDNVLNSLLIIKEYDSYFYETYIANRANKLNIVKGITSSKDYYANTIDEGWFIALAESNTKNPYKTASTIIHEATHLYQYAVYAQLYSAKVSNYLYSYGYDPVAMAKNEIEAYEVQLNFLYKIQRRISKNQWVKREINATKAKISDYKIVRDAGYYMFESRMQKPRCGSKCLSIANQMFQPIFEKYSNNSEYFKHLKVLMAG